MLAAPDLPPNLLWRGTEGNAGDSDGPLDDTLPFLVFGGMVFVNLVRLIPTDGANCKCLN